MLNWLLTRVLDLRLTSGSFFFKMGAQVSPLHLGFGGVVTPYPVNLKVQAALACYRLTLLQPIQTNAPVGGSLVKRSSTVKNFASLNFTISNPSYVWQRWLSFFSLLCALASVRASFLVLTTGPSSILTAALSWYTWGSAQLDWFCRLGSDFLQSPTQLVTSDRLPNNVCLVSTSLTVSPLKKTSRLFALPSVGLFTEASTHTFLWGGGLAYGQSLESEYAVPYLVWCALGLTHVRR